MTDTWPSCCTCPCHTGGRCRCSCVRIEGTSLERGNSVGYDVDREVWVYLPDGEPVPGDPTRERPCVLCDRTPGPDGHDPCLGTIPGAWSACCGHGVEIGYAVYGSLDNPHPVKHPEWPLDAKEPT